MADRLGVVRPGLAGGGDGGGQLVLLGDDPVGRLGNGPLDGVPVGVALLGRLMDGALEPLLLGDDPVGGGGDGVVQRTAVGVVHLG